MASNNAQRELHGEQRGVIAGRVMGALAFAGGLALLVLTFELAFKMFATDPATMLGINRAKPLDLNSVLTTLMSVGVKIVLLVVMAAVGGAVAKHGINLYGSQTSKAFWVHHGPEPTQEPTEKVTTEESERQKRYG